MGTTTDAIAVFSAASGFCIGCGVYGRVWSCESCDNLIAGQRA